MSDASMSEQLCCNCRSREATHTRPYRDVTPTDRGDWIREGEEPWCDECAEDEFGVTGGANE